MMDSFPICHNGDGQRPLAIITDNVIKASELVIGDGRTPITYAALIGSIGVVEGDVFTADEVSVLRSISMHPRRDEIVVLFDHESDLRGIKCLVNRGSFVFSAVKFELGSNLVGILHHFQRKGVEMENFLGAYIYCECRLLTSNLPMLFYYLSGVNDTGWVSVECASTDGRLVWSYSRAFQQYFVDRLCREDIHSLANSHRSINFSAWSDAERAEYISVIISLSERYFRTTRDLRLIDLFD